MSATCQMENVHRIQRIRAELENSLLRVAGVIRSNGEKKRPLNVLFRSSESAQIQISGPLGTADLPAAAHQQISSRFIVSPTPNAVPVMTDEIASKPRPLRVLITKPQPVICTVTKTEKSISVPSAPAMATASSPASSVDSGVGGEVASPGIDNFPLLFGRSPFTLSPQQPQFPSWATVPRQNRRVFNFSTGSLIEALALPPSASVIGKNEQQQGGIFKMEETHLTLQEPPSRKKTAINIQQKESPSSTAGKVHDSNNVGCSNTCSASSAIQPDAITRQNAGYTPSNSDEQAKSSSKSSAGTNIPVEIVATGLPPRSATMPPLKSILKKPKVDHPDHQLQISDLPRNHQRRMPTRIFLCRSISEGAAPASSLLFSPDYNRSHADFNASILAHLTASESHQLDPFDEHLEEAQEQTEGNEEEEHSPQPKGNSSPSTCSSDSANDSQTNGAEAAGTITKKRVSFSEHVQARIYRSNSSILGQRRKNEKKAKHRAGRRCNSDEMEDSSMGNHGAAESLFDADMDGSDRTVAYKQSSPLVCRSRESNNNTSSSIFSSPHSAGCSTTGFSVLAQ